jgi:protein MAK11
LKDHVNVFYSCSVSSESNRIGGSDEQCKIFDLDKRVEHGALTHHEGTVSCVVTHGPTAHLLTASDDNTISVVRMGSWQVEKTLYNHSAGVTALVLHPSG